MFDLAFIWAGLIAFAVLAYVILDGFDLGVGILFPTARTDQDRGLMMNTVAPVWDGNETWLILGGGGLFAVFPLAYAVVLPALYMPLTIMLLALVFRGVSFEYRWRTSTTAGKLFWDWAFFGGSIAAAFTQGITLGALVQGIEVADRAYAGGWWDWLTPFSLLIGIGVVVGYALLGATWLVMKTEGRIQERMRAIAWLLFPFLMAGIALVSIMTPFQDPIYLQRWFTWPGLGLSIIMPVLVIATALRLALGLNRFEDNSPFLMTLVLFVLCFIGVGISFIPTSCRLRSRFGRPQRQTKA